MFRKEDKGLQIQNLEFDQMTGALLKDPKYCQMKQYIQHGRCSTYDHCIAVAKLCFLWGRKLPIEVKEKEMVRGALLHDYYLYDWHNYDGKRHGFRHAKIAEKNASRDFKLSELEKEIIRCHMWPLNISSIPLCREALLVCLADKVVSTQETLFMR